MTRMTDVEVQNKRRRFDAVDELAQLDPRRILAVLGSHNVPTAAGAAMLIDHWDEVTGAIGFDPACLVTGCWSRGVERAARDVALELTGRPAVVLDRRDAVAPPWRRRSTNGERWRDIVMAQSATSLLLVTSGNNVCEHVRDRFAGWGKQVHEIEVEV